MNRKAVFGIGAFIAATTLAVASSEAAPAKQAKAAPAPKISAAAKAEAKEIYNARCVACHGATGAGDGVAAAALNPKPRNFKDAAWQGSIKDADIEKVIKEGGPAIGKSNLMPPNPDLVAKPEVVAALREFIRSSAKK
jgi:mono/diheme cytochrome c family protein